MHGFVTSNHELTPSMRRIVIAGGDLGSLQMPPATDAYINVAIPPADAPYGPVFDPDVVKAEFGREVQPARRRYTVRTWDEGAHEMTIDMLTHGAEGVAGVWAEQAAIGSPLCFSGPSGGYFPDPDADWHLLIGDESATPAIAATLEALSPSTRAIALVLCDDQTHEQDLSTAADANVVWLHRTVDSDSILLEAVENLDFPPGRVHAFVHGEADEIRHVRRHLLGVRGLTRADMSCSPYWRRTMTDEAWRQIKRDYVAEMESEV